jgi:hypothetical protein
VVVLPPTQISLESAETQPKEESNWKKWLQVFGF